MSKRRAGAPTGGFDRSQLRITRGAMILLFVQIGVSLVWLMLDEPRRITFSEYVGPSATTVFDHYRAWTLVTGPFLEDQFVGLVLSGLMLWMFVPTLERFWGMKRFLIFFGATALAGTVAGTLVGLAMTNPLPILGYDAFITACVVAFGILYGRQQVRFFGVLPMTGRQFMVGMLVIFGLFVLVSQRWEVGASYAAAGGVGALLASGRWNPRLWWYKWRHNRIRKKLSVLDGGRARPKKPTDELLN